MDFHGTRCKKIIGGRYHSHRLDLDEEARARSDKTIKIKGREIGRVPAMVK